MRISEVARRTGLNVSNVRFYERKGLLTPDREEENGYRDYTEEDVTRIKQILLYRKMGVSIETIYLLLNGKADRSEILLRQKSELQSQLENLQGAMDLCNLVLQEDQMEDAKLDQYLTYVHEEEKQGKRFAEVEELLEDIVEYTRTTALYGDPGVAWLCQRSWLARIISVGFWLLVIVVPVTHLIQVFMGKEQLRFMMLLVYAVLIFLYGTGFAAYRKARKDYGKGE